MPIVPGPHPSCVMRMSTSTQTFSPGVTWLLPECLARIFSVIVMPGIAYAPDSTSRVDNGFTSIAATGFAGHRTGLTPGAPPRHDDQKRKRTGIFSAPRRPLRSALRMKLAPSPFVLACFCTATVAFSQDSRWSEILTPPLATRNTPPPNLPAPLPSVTWITDLPAAFRQARDENRPLFVTLRCLPCKQ